MTFSEGIERGFLIFSRGIERGFQCFNGVQRDSFDNFRGYRKVESIKMNENISTKRINEPGDI